MKARILTHLPLSGEYPEVSFACVSFCMWVLFSDDEEIDPWIAKFELGIKEPHRKIIYPIENDRCFILSGGQGYLINVATRQLLSKTNADAYEDAIYIPQLGSLLLTDGLRIAECNLMDGAETWSTDRISFDGVSFSDCSGAIVSGRLNDMSDAGCPFSLDLSTRKLTAPYKVIPRD